MTTQAVNILSQHKLRRTDIRIGILEIFLNKAQALSQSDIFHHFEDLDRTTLYRNLKTFEDKGIIHQALDGTGNTKYALCSTHCDEHVHHDHHAHFFCTRCQKTICMEDIIPPKVSSPEGFIIDSTEVVLKGVCKECPQ